MADGHNPQQQAQPIEQTSSTDSPAWFRELSGVLDGFQPEVGASFEIPQITVKPEHIFDLCRTLKDDPNVSFKLLLCLMGVDYKEYFQVVYVLLSLEHEYKLLVKTNVSYEDPKLPSVASVWPAADWYEREAHDLFGITFDGHPGLKPLILYDGFEGYPGRKDFPLHDYQEY